MPETVYILCALTSILCAGLLFRAFRSTRSPLLFWSSLCFGGLAVNNILLFVDLVLVPSIDLSMLRGGVSLLSMMVLVFGLVWESR